jgi:diaminopimelate epimerase
MTISIFEFTDVTPGNNSPIYPALRRRTLQAIGAGVWTQICETGSVAAVVVSNDDGATGVRVRITQNQTDAANQGDVFIAANSDRTFIMARKVRSATDNVLYINAVADT